MAEPEPGAVFKQIDAETIAAVQKLLAEARHGALATLDPRIGHPLATRVGLATEESGHPIIFVSGLAAHTLALLVDPRCSLLIGEVGRGDPLAHRRATFICRAREVRRDEPEFAGFLARYVAAQPKAKLYADLPDFRFFVLAIEHATYNGGFGKAYQINGQMLMRPRA